MPVPRHIQRGWTLVELLVGSAVGLLVIAGIAQIYTAAKHSYDIQTRLAEIQDVGRYAVDVLSRDLRMAGYWGLMDIDLANSSPGDDPRNGIYAGDNFFLTDDFLPDTCTSNSDRDWGRMIVNRIFGLNEPVTGYGCIGADRVRGDILTVRYADPVAIPNGGSFTGTRFYIRTAPFQGSIVQGNPSVCTPLVFPCPSVNYVTDTLFSDHALVAHAYYVTGSGTTVSCGGTSITPPGLARKMLNSSGFPWKESLVNGVEHLQFQYGVDTDTASTDGRVVRYFDADNVPDWNQVVAVRLWVLVRAVCPESGYIHTGTYAMGDENYSPGSDAYRRALFTTTVALRNCKDEYIIGATPPRYQTKCQ